MKKNKQLKNNFIFALIVTVFLTLVFFVMYFLPNQLSWKIFNQQKQFEKAQKAYPNWSLAVESNKLDELYKDKDFSNLSEKLKKIRNRNCNTKSKQISAFCENVFYLDGITNYRLGEKSENDIQEKLWEKAITDFQFTLKINPDNIWAKENIDFILKKKADKKVQKPSQKNGNNKDDNKEKNAKTNSSENQSSKDKSKENKKQEKDATKSSDNAKDGENNSNTSDKNKSRLPKQIQQALEERQKDLENAQKNQKGFARSQSQAKQNKEESQDPFSAFENDPFFKNFFGNDPFFNRRQHNNLQKNLSNQDEKDW